MNIGRFRTANAHWVGFLANPQPSLQTKLCTHMFEIFIPDWDINSNYNCVVIHTRFHSLLTRWAAFFVTSMQVHPQVDVR